MPAQLACSGIRLKGSEAVALVLPWPSHIFASSVLDAIPPGMFPANVQLPASYTCLCICGVRNIPARLSRRALLSNFRWSNVHSMTHCNGSLPVNRSADTLGSALRSTLVYCAIIAAVAVSAPCRAVAAPRPAAAASFNAYINTVESRLAQQHRSAGGFLASEDQGRLRNGELMIETLAPESPPGFSGAMLHHWRGTAFAPGAKAADFERLMRNFNAYPQYYAPQVMQARILSQQGDHYQVVMRVKQHHVITVVLDTAYDVTFAHPDLAGTGTLRGYSLSRSTTTSEIESAGTPKEQALGPGEDHGFLWRLNTYWSYEERDGGLYMQIESVSLTRAIPTGLGWAIGPFVESVPRESLEFTLRATCNALKK